ncbi:MAG TPA: isoprenylcysteine carboxylmethyltransferase family protein [Candidatus Hydrogenedentes bacterium]|nr:isoprenylcysteine carboxylmethyltransferase family protein [Candidatus Hydrogenedentota bacterium]
MKLVVRNMLFVLLVPGTVVVWAPLMIVYTHHLGWPPMDVTSVLGVLCMAIGGMLGLWCVREFFVKGQGTPAPAAPPKHLVVSGLYRYTRNPMYVSVLTILLGEALIWRSGILLIYAGCFFLVVRFFVLGYEEPHLRKTFGKAYEDYCAHVPRWFPYKKGYVAPEDARPE